MLESPQSLKSNYNMIYNNEISLKLVNQQETSLGSSETTCKATSNPFFLFNSHLIFPSHIYPSFITTHFLQWFIGFVEGHGHFIISNNRLFFILNQKDIRTLYRIRSFLGFGKVSSYNGIGRFIVADFTGIERLIHLFNGHLLLNKTNESFKLWLIEYNKLAISKNLVPIPYIESKLNKHLNNYIFINLLDNGWLSGFISANGCFNAAFQSNANYLSNYCFQSRFMLFQKEEIQLLKLFKSNFNTGYVTDLYELNQQFTIDSFEGCLKVIKYLDKYKQFHFIKQLIYMKWKKFVLTITNKKLMNEIKVNKENQKITLLNIDRLKRLANSINNEEELKFKN
jgi:hypothetical protein